MTELGWIARVFLAVFALLLIPGRVRGLSALGDLFAFATVVFLVSLACGLAITAAVGRLPWW
jgi:hypothetical protein